MIKEHFLFRFVKYLDTSVRLTRVIITVGTQKPFPSIQMVPYCEEKVLKGFRRLR